jgi:hypothetical protein
MLSILEGRRAVLIVWSTKNLTARVMLARCIQLILQVLDPTTRAYTVLPIRSAVLDADRKRSRQLVLETGTMHAERPARWMNPGVVFQTSAALGVACCILTRTVVGGDEIGLLVDPVSR